MKQLFFICLLLSGILAWTGGIWGDPSVYRGADDGGGGGVGEAPKGHCHGSECFNEKHHSHAFLSQLKAENSTLVNWHVPMLRDTVRNQAFHQAIKKAINANSIVVDVGAGTGLLSMMASKSGAKKVYAFESDSTMVKVAREVLTANGFADDKITLIPKLSTTVESPSADMPERANVFVSETFDSYLLGEGFLVSLNHAKKNLLTPDAKIIPAGATLFATLIQSQFSFYPEGFVEGFNVNPLRHFHLTSGTAIDLCRHKNIEYISNHFPVFHFDFQHVEYLERDNAFNVPVVKSGSIDGIVIWWKLELDESISFSSGPECNTHWSQFMLPLANEIFAKEGQNIRITAKHTEKDITFTVDLLQ